MAARMRYPIGIQDFRKLREGGFVYVDKTGYIMQLLAGAGYYFLSRPRRFGKSLLLSTIRAYFEGRRELFTGLFIDRYIEDWTPHPVVTLSFNTLEAADENSLHELINDLLLPYEREYGRDESVDSLPQRLAGVLRRAHELSGQKVAVLIDEYDAPLLATLERPELNTHYREMMKALFAVLKTYDEHICFAFVTGVSRFSHTSLFSGANHLRDISFLDTYAAICGITGDELSCYFPESVRELAYKMGVSESEAFGILKENYDGYHFCGNSPDIYNPFSLLSTLDSGCIDDYWFQSGTPSYLIRMLKRDDFFLPDLDRIEALRSTLSVKESYLNNPVALLFESGYITIKDYDVEKQIYSLGLPNKEVATSFSQALIPAYSGYQSYECDNLMARMKSAVIDGEVERFMALLKTFLEGNPYSNTEKKKRERYFKNNLFIVLRALGFRPRAEEETCRARMDVMLETRCYIYIFELKSDGNVSDAMCQIEEKGYASPYIYSGKKIIKIAASYSSALNNIADWEIG